MMSVVTVQYLRLACYFNLAAIEKVVLKNILGPNVNEAQQSGENCIMSKYYLGDQIRWGEVVGHVAHVGAEGDYIPEFCGET